MANYTIITEFHYGVCEIVCTTMNNNKPHKVQFSHSEWSWWREVSLPKEKGRYSEGIINHSSCVLLRESDGRA